MADGFGFMTGIYLFFVALCFVSVLFHGVLAGVISWLASSGDYSDRMEARTREEIDKQLRVIPVIYICGCHADADGWKKRCRLHTRFEPSEKLRQP